MQGKEKALQQSQNNTRLSNRHDKGKVLILNFIIAEVEKGTGLSFSELKKQYNEDYLFQIALMHITTTKKALCTAMKIPIEAGCRYKRTLEKEGLLIQSIDEVVCPYTNHLAHLLSTNPDEFERLSKSKSNQISLF